MHSGPPNSDNSGPQQSILFSVTIKGHFWIGAKFAGSIGHPLTKMLSASEGLCPPDHGLCPWTPLGALPPEPCYRLVLCTCHGAPQPLTPSAAYAYD